MRGEPTALLDVTRRIAPRRDTPFNGEVEDRLCDQVPKVLIGACRRGPGTPAAGARASGEFAPAGSEAAGHKKAHTANRFAV
jgi:hypothetical protein